MSKTERDLLKEKADLLGVSYAPNISTDKLRELVKEANEGPTKEEEVEPVKEEVSQSKEVNPQDVLLELTKKVRVLVTCNDPLMKDYDMTPYYTFSNSSVTLPAITIPLGVEWHIPNAYVKMLESKSCFIPVKGKDDKGRPITTRRKIKKYNINILPPLTAKELDELKQAQIMRDGLK